MPRFDIQQDVALLLEQEAMFNFIFAWQSIVISKAQPPELLFVRMPFAMDNLRLLYRVYGTSDRDER